MANRTDLLVIGAGPYAYSAAAFARHNGIGVHLVGSPMAFWREHMPADMYLRSGADWHLDAHGQHTFEAFFEDRGMRPDELRPTPIGTFLEYTEWFRERQSLDVDARLVHNLAAPNGHFVATLEDGSTITADKVLAAPGVASFVNLPSWYAEVPAARRAHTSDVTSFGQLAGARVVIIGGRQSAYEWAALSCDHGAERVDVVHRHSIPRFAEVSWSFVDQYVDETLKTPGFWRGLSAHQRHEIANKFWEVGRLTLEPWLVPRLAPNVVTSHPGCEVVSVAVHGEAMTLTLSGGATLTADYVVFGSGYTADFNRVPYLAGVLDRVSVTDGFPDLTEGFQTSLPGLYVTGFSSTRDFGPFFGFTKGCPSSARIAVADMLR
ncbi:MAG TPA: FAD-dependent oxidoreductase [Actinomycetales bacterium]|nr:FAD-dependent oxidoreductase [Actinomycetales bacterium]